MKTSPRRRWMSALAGVLILIGSTWFAGQSTAVHGTRSRAGLEGPPGITMQPVTVPAHVSRVAVVPGTGGKEAWATGHMTRASEGWNEKQLVFLHYTSGRWRLHGPPRDASGQPVPNLFIGGI